MKVAVFSAKSYDKDFLTRANAKFNYDLLFFEHHLSPDTSNLGYGFEVVCPFVNDKLDAQVLSRLSEHGTKLLSLRSAGFNHVDIQAAQDLGMMVTRVPAYSPHGVAEHAVALALALNRKIYRAYNRVREGNFSLEGLLGFEISGKTVGVVGTGKIGLIFANIMKGFGASVLAYDPVVSSDCSAEYVPYEFLLKKSDIISLHLPLTPSTCHLIDKDAVNKMKSGVMLINTSRGGLIDTRAVIAGLKSGQIGYLGLDVYEEEGDLFFEDLSGHILQDDVFARLMTFPNVVITGHQAFFTETALTNIAETTLKNISDFQEGKILNQNLVTSDLVGKK
jgi:D-lactate dehydrogenase